MGCKTTKEIWDKLKSTHEGDDNIKEAKLNAIRSQFEVLKMNDEEDIIDYILKSMKLSIPSEDSKKILRMQWF